jgi:hypothetical protein
MTNRNLEIPRPFNFKNLGKGEIIEEAPVEYKDWAPAIQVLKFENGDMMVRFCYYTKSGRIAPRALSIDEDDIDSLKAEIKKKPRVKKFLQMLVE